MPAYLDEKSKTWYLLFYYQDWQGVRKKKHKRGFKLKREAEKWEREFLLKNAGNPEMTFESLVQLYFEDMAHHIRASTMATKKNMIETHILPYFKVKQIAEISNADVRRWQNKMLEKRTKSGEPYKPTYLRSVNSQLSAVFNFAVEFYHLPSNPCSKVKSIGKKKADEMKFWTLDQFNQFIAHEESRAYHLAFMTLYWTGIREGELLALTPKKILDDTKSLNIIHTYKRENGEDVFDATKNSRDRQVAMPDFLYQEMKSYIAALYGITPDDRIFYFTKYALLQEMDRIAPASGVERIRIHDLRHSHVSLLIELGYRTHAIANRIGDTPMEVDKTYAHLYPNKAQDVAVELNRHRDGIIKSGAVSPIDDDGEVQNDSDLLKVLENEEKIHHQENVEPK